MNEHRKCERIKPPKNPICWWCDEPVLDFEPRSPTVNPAHWACGLRAVVGGINHQRGLCTCQGGTRPPDDEGLSRREAANAAAGYFTATTTRGR